MTNKKLQKEIIKKIKWIGKSKKKEKNNRKVKI